MKFKIILFNVIQNHISQWNSKAYHSIWFKIMFFNDIQNHIIQWNLDKIIICKTELYLAVEKENIEIVKLLLTNDKLDINVLNVSQFFFL